MKQNRFRDDEYPTVLEAVTIGIIVISLFYALAFAGSRILLFEKGSLDCSQCHSQVGYETQKMVDYLKKQGYKEPTKWLK